MTSLIYYVSAYPQDPLLIDTDAAEQTLEGFAEGEGKEADGAELESVGHLF